MSTTQLDWREIVNDREKYAAYLCSREWAEKREAVRERARGKCERCKVLPMDACHHLTYKRKYREELEDLQAICEMCHGFTHGKSAFDPARNSRLTRYLYGCRKNNDKPIPVPLGFMDYGTTEEAPIMTAIRQIEVLVEWCIEPESAEAIEDGAIAMNSHLPWNFYSAVKFQIDCGIPEYEAALEAFGFDDSCGKETA